LGKKRESSGWLLGWGDYSAGLRNHTKGGMKKLLLCIYL
jgi:hypothetical protein